MATVTTATGKYTPGYLGAVERTLANHIDEKHVSIKAFGAAGGGADDTAAFLKFRDYCVAAQNAAASAGRPPPHFVLDLPTDYYKTQKPHWLRLIKSVEINGNGSTLQSYGLASPINGLNVPVLGNGLAFFVNTDNATIISNPPTSEQTIATHLFETAAVGDEAITLSDADDAAAYSVGDTIFLSGQPRQAGGYMINVNAFEWVKITAIDGADLSIDRPLQYSYDAAWADHTSTGTTVPFGAPRVLNCTRSDFVFADRIIVRDVAFLGSPTVTYGDAVMLQAWWVTYERCRSIDDACPIHLFSHVSEEINCNFRLGRHEFDKCVNVCRSIGTIRNSYDQAVGVKRMLVSGCTAFAPIKLSAEKLIIEDTTIHCDGGAAFQPYASNYGQRSLIARGNTLVDAGSLAAFTTHGFTIVAVDGTDIVLEGLSEAYLASLRVGKILWRWQDSSSKRGVITDVTHNGEYWVLSGTWGTPVVDEVWYCSTLEEAHFEANTTADGMPVPLGKPCNWALNGGWAEVLSDTIGTATTYQIPLAGVIDEIQVEIIRAYTGSDSTANLSIHREGPLATIATINTKNAGRRSFTQWAAGGALSGDSSTLANMAGWIGGLRIVQTGDSGYYGGSGSELPRYVIRFRGRATDYQ